MAPTATCPRQKSHTQPPPAFAKTSPCRPRHVRPLALPSGAARLAAAQLPQPSTSHARQPKDSCPGGTEVPHLVGGGGHTRHTESRIEVGSVTDVRTETATTRRKQQKYRPRTTPNTCTSKTGPHLPVAADGVAHVDGEGRQSVLPLTVESTRSSSPGHSSLGKGLPGGCLPRRGSHAGMYGRSCRERSSQGQPGARSARVAVAQPGATARDGTHNERRVSASRAKKLR